MVTRRDFLKLVAAAGGAFAVGAGGVWYYFSTRPEAPARTTLHFTGWTYDVAKVQQNIAVFEKWTEDRDDLPDIGISFANSDFGGFSDFMSARFVAGTPNDVCYSSDHWLAKWADAEWIVPIDDYKPEVRNYLPQFEEFSKDGVLYNGKMYGLPYYTDVMTFEWNVEMMSEAGFDEIPSTWEEVTEQALAMKQKGLADYPLNLTFSATPWLEETFFAMVYSRGGRTFDEGLDPLFDTSEESIEALQWVVDAFQTHKILSPATVESAVLEVKEGMKNGDIAGTVLAGYYMGEVNSVGISPMAGKVDIGLMPGTTHETCGWMRFYGMGKSAVDNDVVDEAYLLLEFLGGKVDLDEPGEYVWYVPRRWAVENVLGFSALPLWEDEDVIGAFTRAFPSVDTLKQQRSLAMLKQGFRAPWYPEWVTTNRAEIQKAILGTKSVEDALKDSADEWRRLSAA
ncbi:MAG: extracellular solute-binding protein [Candidatus Geothermarchaeales archaeon]